MRPSSGPFSVDFTVRNRLRFVRSLLLPLLLVLTTTYRLLLLLLPLLLLLLLLLSRPTVSNRAISGSSGQVKVKLLREGVCTEQRQRMSCISCAIRLSNMTVMTDDVIHTDTASDSQL